jgi:hypothetical protein
MRGHGPAVLIRGAFSAGADYSLRVDGRPRAAVAVGVAPGL